MKDIRFFQVDAFTSTPFRGNPAAICLLDDELSVDLMQSIAAENNLAETAFVLRRGEGFNLRWFTPTVEIDLCGHATLATAHILWEQKMLNGTEKARFFTRSGELSATRSGAWIELDFPTVQPHPAKLPAPLQEALGVDPIRVAYAKDRYLIELATEQEVRALVPDFGKLREMDISVVTSLAADPLPFNFISRTFASSHGIDEDPVTGSSHCSLVPYYAEKLNKHEFTAYQASPRGGELRLKLNHDRVLISGQAVTIIEGTMRL